MSGYGYRKPTTPSLDAFAAMMARKALDEDPLVAHDIALDRASQQWGERMGCW